MRLWRCRFGCENGYGWMDGLYARIRKKEGGYRQGGQRFLESQGRTWRDCGPELD